MYQAIVRKGCGRLVVLLFALAPMLISANENNLEAGGRENSELRFGLPLWASGAEGTVDVLGREAEVDDDFCDIVDALEFTAALNFECRKSRWLFFANGLYLETSRDAEPQGPLLGTFGSLEIEQKQAGGDFGLGYGILQQEQFLLELYGGGRATYLEAELEIQVGAFQTEFSDSKFWLDPIVGLYATYRFSEPVGLYAKGDIGGFGVSADLTWRVEGGFDFQLTEHTYFRLAYRYLSMDYKDDGFTFDVDTSGPLLEFGLRF